MRDRARRVAWPRVVREEGQPITRFQVRVAGDGVEPVTEQFVDAQSGVFYIDLRQDRTSVK